ncbi:MAG: hypothetical protein KA138_14480 [Saprospiraceae bacterium]|nr:hypothetical protein [Saprospiraceae bacterium]
MSKDKGTKNIKKAPADRSAGKGKPLSSYKSEGKSGTDKIPTRESFIPKPDSKSGGKS